MLKKLSLGALAAGLLLIGLLLLLTSVPTRAAQFARAGQFEAKTFDRNFEFGEFNQFAADFSRFGKQDFSGDFEGRTFDSFHFTNV